MSGPPAQGVQVVLPNRPAHGTASGRGGVRGALSPTPGQYIFFSVGYIQVFAFFYTSRREGRPRAIRFVFHRIPGLELDWMLNPVLLHMFRKLWKPQQSRESPSPRTAAGMSRNTWAPIEPSPSGGGCCRSDLAAARDLCSFPPPSASLQTLLPQSLASLFFVMRKYMRGLSF